MQTHPKNLSKSIQNYKHIRFIGAAGIGMSALVKVLRGKQELGLLENSIKISESDKAWLGTDRSIDPLSEDIDLAVLSTAIPETDDEYIELKKRGVEFWHRSDMLLSLTEAEGQKAIVVSGTHGKTSCSGLIAHLLTSAQMQPSFVIGGMLQNYKTNGQAGSGEYFVLEGDESDKSFMKTNPHIALVTSVEPDHMENYPGGLEEIKNCFKSFLESADKAVINIDDKYLAEIYESIAEKSSIKTYSLENKEADFYLDFDAKEIYYQGEKQGKIDFKLFGKYSLSNALAATAVANLTGASFEKITQGLASFNGIKRRQEYLGKYQCANGAKVDVYDDYAHHPTEIKALLEAAISEKPKRLVFVYQPHHPLRTRDFWDDFVSVFKTFPKEHLALLVDIYVARSGNIEGINSERMAAEIANPAVSYLDSFKHAKFDAHEDTEIQQVKADIESKLQDGDTLMLVGAGNIYQLAQAFS